MLVDLLTWSIDARGVAFALAVLSNSSLTRYKLGYLSVAFAVSDNLLRFEDAWLRGYMRGW